MKQRFRLWFTSFLILLGFGCSDQDEELSLYEIVTERLLNSTWSVELLSHGNADSVLASGDHSIRFYDDRSLKLVNNATSNGVWELQYKSHIDHFDELERHIVDYSDSLQIDHRDDDEELLLTLIIKKREYLTLTGYWIIVGYNGKTLFLENRNYSLILHEMPVP